MVKINGPITTDTHEDEYEEEYEYSEAYDDEGPVRKYVPSKRGCLKIGCFVPLGLFLLMMVIGALVGTPDDDSGADTEQASETETLRYENIDTSIEEREYSVGKADKHIDELGNLDPQPVSDDSTGDWRIVEHDKGVDFTPYVLSYADEHMNDGEIHWIVDRTNNTLAWIMDAGAYLMVDIYEHNKDDGLDAGSLGGGFELGSYWVYKDNGDIEDVDAIIRDEAAENE